MYTLVSLATAPAAVTTTFSTGLAAVIVILAALGLYGLFHLRGAWRSTALLLILGILVVNIGVLHDISTSLRQAIDNFAVEHGAPEAAGNFTFTLLLIVAFIAFAVINQRSKSDLWKWLMVIVAVLFFTMGWAADAIVWLSGKAAEFLSWVQHLNF